MMARLFRYQENEKWKMQNEIVLDIIEKITKGIGGKFSTKAHHLLSKIKNEDFNPIYTKLNIENISDRFSDIQALETAIKEKKEIKCSYYDVNGGINIGN